MTTNELSFGFGDGPHDIAEAEAALGRLGEHLRGPTSKAVAAALADDETSREICVQAVRDTAAACLIFILTTTGLDIYLPTGDDE